MLQLRVVGCRRMLCLALVLLLSPPPAWAEPKKNLVIWYSWNTPDLAEAYRLFEAEHPGWRIFTPPDAPAGRADIRKLQRSIREGNPPDLLIVDRFSVGAWAHEGVLAPLDGLVATTLKCEKEARIAVTSLLKHNPDATDALGRLIESLRAQGPSRQLDLVRELAKAAGKGQRAKHDAGLQKGAQDLLALCQGVDPVKFYPACWQEACYGQGADRRVYAVPNTVDLRVLYYNPKILESVGGICVDATGKAKPPRSWQELRAYAAKLTTFGKDGRLQRLGFAPNYGNSWLYLYGWQNGGRFLSPDGRTCTLDDPRIVAALRFMLQVYDLYETRDRNGKIVKSGYDVVQEFEDTFGFGKNDAFLTGKVAMKIDGNWFQHQILSDAPKFRFAVAPAPAPRGRQPLTWSGGWGWAIPAGAKNRDVAFELVRFLMTDRVWKLKQRAWARRFAAQGRTAPAPMVPLPHINAWTRKTFAQNHPEMPHVPRNMRLFADLMTVARFRPVTPVARVLWDEHERAFYVAAFHRESPAKALPAGRQRVQDQLNRQHRR